MLKYLLSIFFMLSCVQTATAWQFIDKNGDVITFELTHECDLEACESVFVEAFSEAYRDFTAEQLGVKDKFEFLHAAFQDVYEDFASNAQQLVTAKKDGLVIGFVGFKPTDKPHQIYISQLAVKPEYWRNRIGKHLVLSVFNLFKDTDHLVVIPRKINVCAREFYFKLGFKQCEYMHPGYNPERYIGYEWFKPSNHMP